MVSYQAPHQLWKGCSFCSYRVFKGVSQYFRSFPLLPNPASTRPNLHTLVSLSSCLPHFSQPLTVPIWMGSKVQLSTSSWSTQLSCHPVLPIHPSSVAWLWPYLFMQPLFPELLGRTWGLQERGRVSPAAFSVAELSSQPARAQCCSQKKGEGGTFNPGAPWACVTAASCARKGTECLMFFISLWFSQIQVYSRTGIKKHSVDIKAISLPEMLHQMQHPRQVWCQYWWVWEQFTWLFAGLCLNPGLFKSRSICLRLKLETPMAFTIPASTSSSIA